MFRKDEAFARPYRPEGWARASDVPGGYNLHQFTERFAARTISGDHRMGDHHFQPTTIFGGTTH